MSTDFSAYLVTKSADGQIRGSIESLSVDDLPDGEVLIRVAYSSLNYKDAMAATGHPGVVKRFPHVPGVDAAGVVAQSASDRFREGDEVIVTGYEMGSPRWGGYAQYLRVPADWVVPLPQGLSLFEAMAYGTAGFTAAQALRVILGEAAQGTLDGTDRGEAVVTGASGGVGSFAVALLAKSQFQVAAVTGKASAHEYLNHLGASCVLSRGEVDDPSGAVLLKTRWAAAVDTVGGNILSTIVRSTGHRGCVTVCGMVAGVELPLNVYPFILRGVRLVGIDSAQCPMPSRQEIWSQLAGSWKVDGLDNMTQTIRLTQLDESVKQILAGQVTGRLVVDVSGV